MLRGVLVLAQLIFLAHRIKFIRIFAEIFRLLEKTGQYVLEFYLAHSIQPKCLLLSLILWYFLLYIRVSKI